MVKIISSYDEFVNVLNSARNRKGEYVSVSATTKIKLNKFPTDGGERVRIDDNFMPMHSFKVTLHLGANYEKMMSKVLGVNYEKDMDSNRETIIPNMLMRYKSTNNMCFVCIEESYIDEGKTLNGAPLTEEEENYLARYKSKSKGNVLNYRTISVKNITKLVIGGVTYEMHLNEEKVAA